MALYHEWDVINDFAYVLQYFSPISDSLGSVPNVLINFCFVFLLEIITPHCGWHGKQCAWLNVGRVILAASPFINSFLCEIAKTLTTLL